MLTCRVRPNRSRLPRRSSSAGRPDGADRHACRAAPPRAAETVGDDHGAGHATALRPAFAQGRGAAVGIERQQQRAFAAVGRPDVRLIDAGIGHDEAQSVLDDQHIGPGSHPRTDSDRITSTSRGSFCTSWASSTARADGFTVARSTLRPSALETTFCATTITSSLRGVIFPRARPSEIEFARSSPAIRNVFVACLCLARLVLLSGSGTCTNIRC